MGVGAVFISSLALSKLPSPQQPPADQAELLAAVLQPIISFVVLGSIIIRKHQLSHNSITQNFILNPDGLSIPFFSFGKRVHSRTVSITQTWTARSGNQEPDWITSVRRISSPGSLVSSPTSISNPASSPVEAPLSPHSVIDVPAVEGATISVELAVPPKTKLPSGTSSPTTSSFTDIPAVGEAVVQQRTVRFPTDLPLPLSRLPMFTDMSSNAATGGDGDEVVRSRTVHFPPSPAPSQIQVEDRDAGFVQLEEVVVIPGEQ